MARAVRMVGWIECGAGLAIAVLLIVLPAASLAATPCPTNTMTMSGSVTTSTDPTQSASGVNATGSYNLRQGTLSGSVLFSDVISSSVVDTDDEYWLVGVPPGAPIDFTAQFSIGGSWNVYPGVPQGDRAIDASIASADASAEWPSPFGGWCCHNTVGNMLTIPLHHAVNESFHLRLHLESQQYRGNVSLNGALTFTDLPPGAGIVSCQGFASNPPVSVGGAAFSSLRLSAPRPNPARAGVSAAVSLPLAGGARLEVIDLQGRIRFQRALAFASAGTHEVRLDAARGFEPGSYFLRVTQAGRTAIRSFTVVR